MSESTLDCCQINTSICLENYFSAVTALIEHYIECTAQGPKKNILLND